VKILFYFNFTKFSPFQKNDTNQSLLSFEHILIKASSDQYTNHFCLMNKVAIK